MCLLGTVLAAACLASVGYVLWLPDVSSLKHSNPRTTSYIELRREAARRAGEKFTPRMVWVPWERISEHLKRAVFAAEDGDFYIHDGVNWDRIKEAVHKDWASKSLAYGGSTITQQVARNLYLSPSKNPLRKLKEMLIAKRLEAELGKRRIFELYLNIAEWGDGIFGAEAAAQAYFGKSAADLNLDEAVAMAVVLPNPRRWNPAEKSPYVESNRPRIMGCLRWLGLLPEEAAKSPPTISESTPSS